jgi:hypothetical protein
MDKEEGIAGITMPSIEIESTDYYGLIEIYLNQES